MTDPTEKEKKEIANLANYINYISNKIDPEPYELFDVLNKLKNLGTLVEEKNWGDHFLIGLDLDKMKELVSKFMIEIAKHMQEED